MTEITVFGSNDLKSQLQSVMLETTDQARNLGVIMDSQNFSSRINTVTVNLLSPEEYIQDKRTYVSAGFGETCSGIYLQQAPLM